MPRTMADLYQLAQDTVNEAKVVIEKHGGPPADAADYSIPSPETDRDKLMAAAGQLRLALFLVGATMMAKDDPQE